MTARVSVLVALLCSLVGAAGEDAGCSAQLAQVQGELADAQKQLLAASQMFAQKVDKAEVDKVQAQLNTVTAEREQSAAALATATAELKTVRGQLAQMVEKAHLETAQAELETCKNKPPPVPPAQAISVSGAAHAAWSVASDGVTHLLDQTDVDDQVYEHATKHYGTVKELASDMFNKATSVDVATLVQDLQKHELYTTHVSPNLEKVTTAVKPHWDQHAAPLLDKAQEHAGPVLKQVQEHYAIASKKVQEEVVPVLRTQSTQALDAISEAPVHVEKATSYVDKLLAPIFTFLAKLSPSHAGSLPTGIVDRILFLLLCTFFTYQLFFIVRRLLKITFRVTRVTVKVNLFATRVFVLLPISLMYKVFRLMMCFVTLFYCCGLCRRKKAADKKTNGINGNGKVAAATEAELTSLLEEAKKEKKLEAAAKQFVKLMNSAQPLSNPKKLSGKVVTKEVLKKVVGKYKELDAKKLGL